MKKEIREINAPAIDLIADILDKHVDAILGEVKIRFKQIKADQSIEADRQARGESVDIDKWEADFYRLAKAYRHCVKDDLPVKWAEIEAHCRKLYLAPQPKRQVSELTSSSLGPIKVGNLPTANQDDYPDLGDWWVQLRIGPGNDEVLARVYGSTPQQAYDRAVLLVSPQPQQIPEGYALVPIAPTPEMLNSGWAENDVPLALRWKAMLEAAPEVNP